jgi:AraC family transcriptional regulator, transcriptional activator of pobA
MKNAIPRYNFYKTKYGSELLIDVVDLQYTRKFLTQGKVHILTYYDITFITEGEGEFTIGNRTHLAAPGDVFFSKPGEVRSWDTDRIGNGHALIFEDTFLTSFFKDPLFVQHLPFFRMGKMVDKLQLPNGLYARILQLLHDIKVEIDSFHPHDTGILRALLYEVLMLLNRAYCTSIPPETGKEPHKDISSFHLSRFFELVGEHFREQHSVQFYADKLCISHCLFFLWVIVSRAKIAGKWNFCTIKKKEDMSLFTVSPFSGRRGEYTLYIVGNYVQSRRRLRNGVRRLFLKWGGRCR